MQCENQVVLVQVLVYRARPVGSQTGYLRPAPCNLLLWQILSGVCGASRIPDVDVEGGLEHFRLVVLEPMKSSQAVRNVELRD